VRAGSEREKKKRALEKNGFRKESARNYIASNALIVEAS
jgi:hypothetical protein